MILCWSLSPPYAAQKDTRGFHNTRKVWSAASPLADVKTLLAQGKGCNFVQLRGLPVSTHRVSMHLWEIREAKMVPVATEPYIFTSAQLCLFMLATYVQVLLSQQGLCLDFQAATTGQYDYWELSEGLWRGSWAEL